MIPLAISTETVRMYTCTYTYKLVILNRGLFDDLTVKRVKNILKQELHEDDSRDSLRTNFKSRLVEELGDHFMCNVNPMGSSYFINVFSRGRKIIQISAERRAISLSLKDIAAYAVGRELSEAEDVKFLDIPDSVHEDVKYFIGCS